MLQYLQSLLCKSMRCCLVMHMVWFAHHDGRCQRSRVQWRVSWPQRTNFHLERYICTTWQMVTSEILRTSMSKHCSLGQGMLRCMHHALWWHVSLAHAQIVHMSIVLLHVSSLLLGCIDCYCYLLPLLYYCDLLLLLACEVLPVVMYGNTFSAH